MSFTEAVSSVYRNYANFSGRASRAEYWWFVAFFILVYLGFLASIVVLPRSALYLALLGFVVFAVGSIIPNLALSVRRLHDTNRTGWWLLISLIPFGGFVLLFFWLIAGDPMPNQYGPPPPGTPRPAYWYGGQAGYGYGGQAGYGYGQPTDGAVQPRWPSPPAPPGPSEADVHPLSRNPPPPTRP